MKRIRKRNASLAVAILLLTIAPAPNPVAATLVLAQATFPVPASVPQGTSLKIDGSTSMTAINQALGDRFKAKFPGTEVNVSYGGSDAALQSVLDGKIDLAAIGSPLTPEQKAKGLVEVPVARHKIAVFVGANNPFTNSLTGEQFASIFRGELTDWSQVGGSPAPIRLIDRPDTSDTRRALSRYPVFQAAPFRASATAKKLESDSTDAVILQLGNNEISYAIADQVVNNPAVRVLPMYGTLPSEASYPFSQPLAYVYKGDKPSAAVQAFLGFATAPENQADLEAARVAAATGAVGAVTSGAGSPNAEGAAGTSPAPTAAPASPDATASPAVPASPAATASPAPANPAVESPQATVSPSGAIAPATTQATPEEGEGLWRWWWLIPALASLGILAWLLRGRSAVDAPIAAAARTNAGGISSGGLSAGGMAAGTALGVAGATAAGIGAAGIGAMGAIDDPAIAPMPHDSRIILTPRTCREAYAYWEVDDAHKSMLKQQGGNQLALRLYEVTDIDLHYQAPHSVHEFACDETATDLHVPIPTDDRDYIAELGYITDEHRWLPLARSPHVRVPACTADDHETASSNGSDRANVALDNPSVPSVATTSQPATADRSANRLILVPRSAADLYAYWELPEQQKQIMQQQGGQKLILRVYDITGVDLSNQPPRSVQQFECEVEANDRHVAVPDYGDYIATLGYMTPENRWVSLARSTPVRIRVAGGSSSSLRDRS